MLPQPIAGTLLLAGHPVAGVAAVSSLGFALAFGLALARLRAATHRHRPSRTAEAALRHEAAKRCEAAGELGSRCRGPGAGLAAELEVPDRLGDDFLPDADHRVGRNVKVHDAAASDYCISADPARADDHGPARNPGTHLDDNVPIEGAMRHLALRTRHPEVMGSGQQHDIVTEEDIFTDVHMPAHSIYENITQADRVTDADARDRPAHERPPEKTSDPPVAEAAELVTWNIPFAREAFPEEPGPAPHGGVAARYHHSPPAPGSRMCP